MVRMREPQRYPLGTRVANPLEGRVGEIAAFDLDTGLYTLAFHDGYREQVDSTSVDRLIIRPSASEQAAAETKKQQEKEEEKEDPSKLLGVAVTKTWTSYEGKKLVSTGHVTSYFSDIRKFRVLFGDGTFVDMTVDEVKASMKTADTDGDNGEAAGSSKRPAETDDASTSKKKRKKSKHHHHTDNTTDSEKDELERPLSTTKFPSRKVAYAMTREVLKIVMSQKKLPKVYTEKQRAVLENSEIQPKKALRSFVEADGLQSLETILKNWFRMQKTRSGALLVLKVLALLPGVTEQVLRKTTIGITLRSINQLSRTMDDVEDVLGDMAHWIIEKWKKMVMNRSFNQTPKELLQAQAAQISRAGSNGQVYVAPSSIRSAQSPQVAARRKETARLQALRTSPTVPVVEDTSQPEEEVVYLPQYNSLGSEDMTRPVRQTKMIESLAAKINRDYEDGLKTKHSSDKEEDDGITTGRIVFGKPQIMLFRQTIPAADLFATARTKLMDKTSTTGDGIMDGSASLPGEEDASIPPRVLPPPNKTQTPAKSILKVKTDEVVPASKVKWT